MTLNGFALILFSITCSACGQTAFKIGVDRVSLPGSPSLFEKIFGFFSSPFILTGLVFHGVGTIFWLFALRQLDLSLAYPFVALSIVVVFLVGIIGLGEPANAAKITGLALIAIGLTVLARA